MAQIKIKTMDPASLVTGSNIRKALTLNQILGKKDIQKIF